VSHAELAELDATGQAELVRSGEASPRELVEAAIERAERLNPEVNAIIIERYDEARSAARGDVPGGPFRGVPFALKDLGAGAVAGEPLHMGMRALKEADFRAPMDSYLTMRFREAGFVSIGRTNTPELGILPTTEPKAYGASRNPWDLERSTGGSSGGSAAAVAAGIVPVAHASDGGGSIRIPASCCGLVGLKTTRQRISQGPLIGDFASGLAVDFLLARSLRDVAAVLDAVHGPAPGDPYVAPPPSGPYLDALEAEPKGLHIGLITEPPVAMENAEVSAVVVEAARDAAELFESLGHRVDTDVPALPDLSMGELDPVQAFFNRYYAGQAVTVGQMGAILGRELGPGDMEPLTWAMAEEGRKLSGGDYLASVGMHQALGRFTAGWFEAGYDLILSPTMAEPPPPLGTFDDSGDDPLRALRRAVTMGGFTGGYNATGHPALSLPLFWSEHETGGADGAPSHLPIGVQLAAPFGHEEALIAIGAQLEQARPWAERRPGLFAATTS
jgi:amidase